MATRFSKGDRVEWSVGTGNAVGTVQRRVTEETELNGQTVSASEKEPRYFVKNNNTGNITSHRPGALSLSKDSHQDDMDIGDKVEWNTAQGKTTGTIKEKLTKLTQIKNYDVKASEENPKYLVESEQTGSEAAHRPDALRAC